MNSTNKKRRVGIMGGTFDPIHIGHLILGEKAHEQFQLDEVLFMPSGNPPHKQNRRGRAGNKERVELVSRAIMDNPHFSLSLEEMHDEGYTYTRQTLEKLTAQNPDTEYYFIMGADSLLSFHTWKDPQEICRLCVLVVATRDHLPQKELDRKIAEVSETYHANIQKLSTLNIDVSSHMLRQWIYEGRSCRYYMPVPVIEYIRKEGLYLELCENGE
ncbi:MAG: nicotinate-nucleotide adenylyltransferase [Lachnospiraceae bacterium]|nr:nicotinate-nucleotide adenylyltransferase [Lachnospiraceae bacterium]